MPPSAFHLIRKKLKTKRDSVFNFGGYDSANKIYGDKNAIQTVTDRTIAGQETLIRKAGHQVGRVLEGGADLATASAKWLSHIHENG